MRRKQQQKSQQRQFFFIICDSLSLSEETGSDSVA